MHRVLGRREDWALLKMAGAWEHVVSEDSVFTELLGLWRVLVAAGDELRGQVVLHRTDSLSTYWVVQNGGSQRSARLTAIVRRIMVYCLQFEVTLAAQYVGAGVIIKSGADWLSRDADQTDCMLHTSIFDSLWARWGPFKADMFASNATAQHNPGDSKRLPYWSLWADGLSMGVDALTADWADVAQGGVLYAFPPVQLVGEVVQLVHECQVQVVLIVPRWPSQWWWPWLLEHARGRLMSLSQANKGPVMCPGRRGGLPHPFGPGYACPEAVQWVAVKLD